MKRRVKKIRDSARAGTLAQIMPVTLFGLAGASGFFIFLASIFMLVSTFQPSSLSGVRTATANVVAPVLQTISTPMQKAAVFVRDVSGLAAIQAENARLMEENVKLREWYQTALLLEAENKSLRELMNVKTEPQNTYITARILSDGSNTFVKSLLVSAGTQDGVQKGQAVIAGDGLIGRVVEAGDSVARVLLITDINSRVPVLVEDSRQHAIFAGTNNLKGTLMHLPPESEMTSGARIVTSGMGGIFPVGLPVGIAQKLDDGSVKVEPFANFDRLMHVRIVKKPEDPNLRSGALGSGALN